MRFQVVSFLAALPFSLANLADLSYSAPPERLAAAQKEAGCNLPAGFQVSDFTAKTNSTGPTPALTAYSFAYSDPDTDVAVKCSYNSSSVSTTPGSLTPRYACENSDVKFILSGATGRTLTLIERICPGPNGVKGYEVAGALDLALNCSTTPASCKTSSNDVRGNFTSLDPVTDPTRIKRWVS
ncbi:hypothetical protein MKX07_001728 [Trichoderma sp. CBMAI-0711]|uniref:SSCRP protein n=1 Tax=Trichoderma parareesei TaxID=858221 RepID=A0A2H2ZKC6_TRIPA|nr:hypothetical protein MKX07_001728 [Trichoderma sp. CBMAI-0711]OTA03620.1 SSCRP protein [Trichoderma parareesei]